MERITRNDVLKANDRCLRTGNAGAVGVVMSKTGGVFISCMGEKYWVKTPDELDSVLTRVLRTFIGIGKLDIRG
jgi:hypothetical protein